MVDRTLILRKLAEIEEYLEQIREYESITLEEYSNDWKTQRIVERTLQMMIEVCVDVASHIISDKNYRIPTTYSDAFRVLYENRILGEELFNKMDKMAKFRNVIVHQYDKVDAEIVIGVLKNFLNDFLSYTQAVKNMLQSEKTD